MGMQKVLGHQKEMEAESEDVYHPYDFGPLLTDIAPDKLFLI